MKPNKTKEAFNSFLDNKVARLNQKHKIGICIVAVLVPALAFYFLCYTPKCKEIKQLRAKEQKLEQEIKRVEATVRNLEKHKAEMKETTEMFQMASHFLPQQQEIPTLLTSISSKGTSSGLEIETFKPKSEILKEFYAEIPVDIQVRGPYHNVGVFLYEISKLSRIVSVSSINMSSPKKEDGEMILNTKFNLVTYRFIESSGKTDEKKKKK